MRANKENEIKKETLQKVWVNAGEKIISSRKGLDHVRGGRGQYGAKNGRRGTQRTINQFFAEKLQRKEDVGGRNTCVEKGGEKWGS